MTFCCFCVELTHDVDHDVALVLALVVLQDDGVDPALLPPRVDHREIDAVASTHTQFKSVFPYYKLFGI